ncbi:MAG: hypothetical protein LWW86_12760 [Micrococcales bacterium]|nr:hypothetical protein [Micrococcales bacterium]
MPVQSSSMTNLGALALESGLEHELATVLDRQTASVWLVAQPARLAWEDGLSHHPDLLSVDSDGNVTVWDARAVERRDETFLVKASRTETACREIGWAYSLFGGLPLVESLNLRWIAGARRPPEWLDVTRGVLLRLVAEGPVPVGQVMAADDGRGFLISAMWHLVWTGELVMDMSKTWDTSTPVNAPTDARS